MAESPVLSESQSLAVEDKVRKVVKEQFEEFKAWMDDKFQTKTDCSKAHTEKQKEEVSKDNNENIKHFRIWMAIMTIGLVAAMALGLRVLQLFGFLKGF